MAVSSMGGKSRTAGVHGPVRIKTHAISGILAQSGAEESRNGEARKSSFKHPHIGGAYIERIVLGDAELAHDVFGDLSLKNLAIRLFEVEFDQSTTGINRHHAGFEI